MTMSTGSRSVRRRHSVASTASAATACSSRVGSEPRSTTRARASRRSRSSTTDSGVPRAQSSQRSTPRFAVRSRSARAVGSSEVNSSSSVIPPSPRSSSRSANSSRSATGSSPSAAARAAGSSCATRSCSPAGARRTAIPRATSAYLAASCLVRAAPRLGQPHVVGVGVEDDEAQAPSRPAAAPASGPSEYVFPEPDWPQRNVCRSKPPASSCAGTPGREQELADLERRARRPRGVEPRCHLRRLGRSREAVVERAPVAGQHHALPAREPERHLGLHLGRPVRARHLGALDPGELQRGDLAQALPRRPPRARRSRPRSAPARAATPAARTAGRPRTSRAGGSTPPAGAGGHGTRRCAPAATRGQPRHRVRPRRYSSIESAKARPKPRVVRRPTSLPPCSNASGIIVSASMVRIAPPANASVKASADGPAESKQHVAGQRGQPAHERHGYPEEHDAAARPAARAQAGRGGDRLREVGEEDGRDHRDAHAALPPAARARSRPTRGCRRGRSRARSRARSRPRGPGAWTCAGRRPCGRPGRRRRRRSARRPRGPSARLPLPAAVSYASATSS